MFKMNDEPLSYIRVYVVVRALIYIHHHQSHIQSTYITHMKWFICNGITIYFFLNYRSLKCYRTYSHESPYGYCYLTNELYEQCKPPEYDPIIFGGQIVTRNEYCYVCLQK